MKKSILALIFCLTAICSWADDSGTCGENLTWTYVEATQTLTISGTGEMTNFPSSGRVPWYGKGYNTSISKIVIEKGVTAIGNSAFYGCTGLTSITIPNSVTAIGWYSFSGCTGLNEIIIPNSVTAIGGGAFEGTAWYDNQSDEMVYAGNVAYKYKGTMPANTHIQLKEGTTGISGSAFSGCTGLTSIDISNNVTSIGESAFSDCTGLTSIEIPNSVTSIGGWAFENCTGLTSVTIGNSVTSIGSSTFCGCTRLTSIQIPNSVTSIGDGAFGGCTGLTSIEIPNSVISIGFQAFDNCTSLTEIHISSFDAWCRVKGGAYAFYFAPYHYLILNEEQLKNAVIPSNVESIDNVVFGQTIGIESLAVLAKRPPKVANDFASPLYETCTLYVPEGSENAYYVAEGWKNFKKIETFKEEQTEKVPQDVNGDGVVDTQDVLEIYKYIQEH